MTARTFAFTKTTPYYRRHRELPVLTSSDELGSPADMLITRYGDQGSRYYRPWDAYYHEGKFYRIVSHVVALDDDGKPAEYTHAFAPITNAPTYRGQGRRIPRRNRDHQGRNAA